MAVITFSRSYGSGGNEVAGRVCELLGYRYFDKHLLAQLASEMGITGHEVTDYSEEKHAAPGLLARLRSAMGVGRAPTFTPESLSRLAAAEAALDLEASQALVEEAVRAACALGDVVILGRGGSVVLKDEPNALHVFVDAPLADRARRVALREHIDEGTARDRWIAVRDEAAADYMRRFYGVVWSDPLLYHLVINTGRWDVETAARLVIASLDFLPAPQA